MQNNIARQCESPCGMFTAPTFRCGVAPLLAILGLCMKQLGKLGPTRNNSYFIGRSRSLLKTNFEIVIAR
jgi:hypothetical protein